MKTITTLISLILSLSNFANTVSLDDLIGLENQIFNTTNSYMLTVINNPKKEYERASQMTPTRNDFECRYTSYGRNLSFKKVIEFFDDGSRLDFIIKETEIGRKVAKGLEKVTFLVAQRSCATHNYTLNEILAISTNKSYGFTYYRETD